jgi:hypothetical protein
MAEEAADPLIVALTRIADRLDAIETGQKTITRIQERHDLWLRELHGRAFGVVHLPAAGVRREG